MKNHEIDGFLCDYETAVALIKKVDKNTGKDSCGTLGFLPRGKSGWTEFDVAGIVKKAKNGWVSTKNFYMLHAIDAALINLKNDGTIDELNRKWRPKCDAITGFENYKICKYIFEMI